MPLKSQIYNWYEVAIPSMALLNNKTMSDVPKTNNKHDTISLTIFSSLVTSTSIVTKKNLKEKISKTRLTKVAE
jgi:hypothetical protein